MVERSSILLEASILSDRKPTLSLSIGRFKGHAIGCHSVWALWSVAVLFLVAGLFALAILVGILQADAITGFFEMFVPLSEENSVVDANRSGK